MINFFQILDIDEKLNLNEYNLKNSFEKIQKKAITQDADAKTIYNINQAYSTLRDEKKRIDHYLELRNLKNKVYTFEDKLDFTDIINKYFFLYEELHSSVKLEDQLILEKENIQKSILIIIDCLKSENYKEIFIQITKINYSKRLIDYISSNS